MANRHFGICEREDGVILEADTGKPVDPEPRPLTVAERLRRLVKRG